MVWAALPWRMVYGGWNEQASNMCVTNVGKNSHDHATMHSIKRIVVGARCALRAESSPHVHFHSARVKDILSTLKGKKMILFV